jgi:UDP-N-acetylmuramate dehydrogenase
MISLDKFMEKINTEGRFQGLLRYNEPMSAHTTFKTGGAADVWVRPRGSVFPSYAALLLKAAKQENIPVFVLGAGANILVSDRGIRGIVLDTGAWQTIGKREERTAGPETLNSAGPKGTGKISGTEGDFEALKARRESALFSVSVFSGASVDGLADRLAQRGLSGLEFLAGMPGSVGGAVWMNARCYEKSVSDILIETEILDENFKREKIPFRAEDFGYKKSPFQERQALILSVRFAVRFREPADMKKEMSGYRRDRIEKGHYRFPSAGSVFKNNRDFGEPTGKIVDQLGLRGLGIGGAQVAPWHGNIIINTGGAKALDIRILINEVARRVKEERGFDLESEIIFAGDWPDFSG